jgi:capsular exopolysaccharide synthesis family protein
MQPPPVKAPEANQPGVCTAVIDTALSEALITLRKRKLALIVAVVFGLLYGIFKTASQPNLYEAYGRIQIRSGSSNEYRVNAVQGYGGDSSSKMLTEIEILKSDSLMLKVSREMDLSNNADFLETLLKLQLTGILRALVFSLIAAIVVAFAMESLKTGLRSIAEIEAITELSSLAVIPRAGRSPVDQTVTMTIVQRNIGILTQPKSQFAEAFRSLRTSLLSCYSGHAPKYIVLTSATPSEGKTTVASNIAGILAQNDTRVLLIDGDLRRPSIHHRFGLNGKVGLTTVLTGATTLEGTVQRVHEISNLDILPSGPVPAFPSEMLDSGAMNDVLKRCGELYDYVVIDSPPILSVADGVILARHADAVALVVLHGKSTKRAVRHARDLILRSGASITGIVLNAVDLSSPEYYGYTITPTQV